MAGPATGRIAALALETALNRLLREPALAGRLRPLAGKTLRVDLCEPTLTLTVRPDENALRVDAGAAADSAADVTVRASAAALAALARGERDVDGVYIEGEMRSAQILQRLFADLDIDAETLLAAAIGELPAHQAARLLRGAARAGRDAGRRVGDDLADFLRYERGLLPPRHAVERWAAETAALSAELDRLEARVQRLDRR